MRGGRIICLVRWAGMASFFGRRVGRWGRDVVQLVVPGDEHIERIKEWRVCDAELKDLMTSWP